MSRVRATPSCVLPLLTAAVLAAAQPARADDIQAWPGVTATGPVRGNLGVWFESQLRFDDDVSRTLNRNARLGLGWDDGDGGSAYLGYAIFRATPQGQPANTEHRSWEQFAYKLGNVGKVRLSGRSRLEQRFREGRDDEAWRMRQMVRGVLPLGGRTAPSLVLQSEVFIEFADTSWQVKEGFDQLRTFGGVRLPVRDKVAVEAGYLNQSGLGPGRVGTNHIAQVTLAINF